ncbi:hypothetical protein J6590_060530 [Homalodisca vitripennis]|nr:hypothetical protein J6590_060530 [Homalodisca vitripennis]
MILLQTYRQHQLGGTIQVSFDEDLKGLNAMTGGDTIISNSEPPKTINDKSQNLEINNISFFVKTTCERSSPHRPPLQVHNSSWLILKVGIAHKQAKFFLVTCLGRAFKKSRKTMGPSTDPWKTPLETANPGLDCPKRSTIINVRYAK